MGKPGANGYSPTVSDEEFVSAWKDCNGNVEEVSRRVGLTVRSTYNARRKAERNLGVLLLAEKNSTQTLIRSHKARISITPKDAVLPLASDAHVWPGERTTVQRAYVKMVKKLKPSHVILMGDVFDGARISSHPRIGFLENRPTVDEELKAVGEFLKEIEDAAPPGAVLIWCLGNHDARYESYLAARVPEMENVSGFHLKDRFPKWIPCWSVHINEGTKEHMVIKHRWHGGIHSSYNNVLRGGVHIATAHLHKLDISKWTNYTGTHYGVDGGFMADCGDPQFNAYLEDNQPNWQSGFPIITFRDGRLMRPEFVVKWEDDVVEFRGELINV